MYQSYSNLQHGIGYDSCSKFGLAIGVMPNKLAEGGHLFSVQVGPLDVYVYCLWLWICVYNLAAVFWLVTTFIWILLIFVSKLELNISLTTSRRIVCLIWLWPLYSSVVGGGEILFSHTTNYFSLLNYSLAKKFNPPSSIGTKVEFFLTKLSILYR